MNIGSLSIFSPIQIDCFPNISVINFFLGCLDNRETKHSIGQQFITEDCHQCFCDDGGSISCNQLQCKSSKLNINPAKPP